jgi:integrase
MQGHIRKRGNASYEYIVDVGTSAAQRCQGCGRRFWVERKPRPACPRCGGSLVETEERRRTTKAGFATRKECAQAMNRLLVSVAEQSFIATTRLTVREYLQQEWLPAAEATVRPSTYNSYVQHVDCHVVPFIGTVQLQKLSGATLNGLYGKLAASGRKNGKRGLSPMTVHHVHSCLHRALRDAVRWGRLTRNPADAADPPRLRASAHEMRTWSAEQLQVFLGSTKEERLGGLWHLLALTGMRRGEALGLRWDDIDLQAARLSVRRALIPTGGEVVVSEPKTAKGRRVIALDATTVCVLKAQASRQLTDQTQCGDDWVDSGYVFTIASGEPLDPEDVTRYFRQAVKRAMLPQIRLHDLRHTHATLALQAGVHPKVVSERLGHATVAITLDTYSHAIPAMQEEAAALIAGLVFADSRAT